MDHTTYVFDDIRIVYEIINSEVVLVNLDNGYYYILDDIASEIWQTLQSGISIDEAVDVLSARYESPPEILRKGIDDLVKDLLEEDLLTAVTTSKTDQAIQRGSDSQAESKKDFHFPAIFKYTDMEYLIQMDPIWEYDETGWPKRRVNPPSDEL